jgi:hypothetical protein
MTISVAWKAPMNTINRVLDIDLDFFLNDVHYFSQNNCRLSSEDYKPWSADKVVAFLENNCGINRQNKIRGKIVTHHQEAFFYWRQLVINRDIKVPFDVVHIDAHADLGLGDAGWVYLMGELLHKKLNERIYPKEGSKGLNAGNYLAFAIACRWVKC